MGKKEEVMFVSPPRLLLGVTFLFWGAMHDRALPALVAAILVEGRHWTNLRWEFGEKGFARAWQLSVLILIVSTIGLFQIEEAEARDFLNLLSWLPFMMMPLALAQQYCSDRGVPMTTFSFIARRKMAADRKAGRMVENRDVNLGYPYLFLILIGAGIGRGNILKPGLDEIHYAVGVSLLLGWGLYRMRKVEKPSRAWGLAYLASLLVALSMVWGVVSIYQQYIRNLTRPAEQAGSPFETLTSIGQVGKLQLSDAIVWRYYHEGGKLPDLVKISSYNWPEGDLWRVRTRRIRQKERIAEDRAIGGDFEKFLEVGKGAFLFHQDDAEVSDFGTRGEIVGMVSDQSLIPHPLRTKRLEQVATEVLSANSMGAIQLNGPNQAAMRIKLFADERLEAVEHDPAEMDLRCPSAEEEGLDRFLRSLGLEAVPWTPKVRKGRVVKTLTDFPKENLSLAEFTQVKEEIRSAFLKDFLYTVFLEGMDESRPMAHFVNEKKKGHCEYFAGATTLLLRRMGIPSRYVVGFAVREEGDDANEYLIRGKHAHSWTQAYVGGTWINEAKPGTSTPIWRCRGGKWVDVDLTPPDWLSLNDDLSWYQGILDWFQKAKANFVLWFSKSSVTTAFKILLVLLVSSLLIYLVYKMMKTKGREGRRLPGSWEEKLRKQGYLKEFERWLARRVGSRPSSMPMASWLREHLPEEAKGLAKSYEVATFHPDGIGAAELGEEIQAAKLRWKEAQKTP